jgi:penicillin G amidase
MRRTLRALSLALGLLASLLVLAIIGGAGLVWLTLPNSRLTGTIPGLSAPVGVQLDADGIPRIRAATETDAAAALGFLHARDRMFQMELMRRAASGEIAEIAGPAALPLDRMMRTLGLRRRAEADLPILPAETRALLEAYARGVNAYIARRGRFTGLEFLVLGAPAPWTPVDSLLWGKTMGLYLSGNWRTELARAALAGRLPQAAVDALWPQDTGGPGQPQASAAPALAGTASRLAALLPRFPDPFTRPDTASNAWAIDGRHTASFAPMLAGDPHLEFSLPGVWYLARIETPGGVLVGATAPGVPMLVLGHNGHIAWSFTTTGADVQDLFVETPAGEGQYLTPDGPRPFTVRKETIHVRGAPDEVLTVRETRHGPVVSDLARPDGPILALEAANLAPGIVSAAGLLALDRAQSVAEAGAAAAMITSPVQNLMVADRAGIGLFVTGRVPIRRAGDGRAPVPGADGSHDWIGWASGSQLPHYVAPDSGRLVNANEPVAPPDFPVFLGRDAFDDARARRIREMLARTDRHTPTDFAAMQVDTLDLVARAMLPRLRRVAAPEGIPARALALLQGWEGDAGADRPEPLIFNAWMQAFADAVLARLGVPPGSAAAAPWSMIAADAAGPHPAFWCGGDCGAILAETLGRATGNLAARFGPDPATWRWGTAHQAVFAHALLGRLPVVGPLATVRIAQGGDDSTVGRGGVRHGSLESIHGASFRGVYDLADLDGSLFMAAPGQSGHVISSLSRNFVQRWREGGTITISHLPASVAAELRLTPP